MGTSLENCYTDKMQLRFETIDTQLYLLCNMIIFVTTPTVQKCLGVYTPYCVSFMHVAYNCIRILHTPPAEVISFQRVLNF